jgi:hypothetical protein
MTRASDALAARLKVFDGLDGLDQIVQDSERLA